MKHLAQAYPGLSALAKKLELPMLFVSFAWLLVLNATRGGRVLRLGISVYAAAMFGYLTALFATFLIDRETKTPKVDSGLTNQALQDVKDEVLQLRRLLEDAIERLSKRG